MILKVQTLLLYIRTNLLLYSLFSSLFPLVSSRLLSLRFVSSPRLALSHLLRFESFQGYGAVRCGAIWRASFFRCFAKKIFLLSVATTRYAVFRLRSGLCGNGWHCARVRGGVWVVGRACVVVAMAIARGLGSSPKRQSVAPDSAPVASTKHESSRDSGRPRAGVNRWECVCECV
ncbi:uncharacterized protein DI49_2992 [Saccharomyces eubayanus]|uniref:uncharacterized protein n=1 Tax=Saccharomyces eubayanus TaxID=1080349 RepID=UPI0006C3495E|nr:hypothetical protein DI49_2992 [Saccharomyces eubayanus]KOG98575.1 hypothetical protein DI49_2992 [Saccharomyces eubayanus]